MAIDVEQHRKQSAIISAERRARPYAKGATHRVIAMDKWGINPDRVEDYLGYPAKVDFRMTIARACKAWDCEEDEVLIEKWHVPHDYPRLPPKWVHPKDRVTSGGKK